MQTSASDKTPKQPIVDLYDAVANYYHSNKSAFQAGFRAAMPTHIFMDPFFWSNLALSTASTGANYQMIDPTTGMMPITAGLNVVKTNNLEWATTKTFAVIVDLTSNFLRTRLRQGLELDQGTQKDDFEKVNRSFRAHMRLALLLKRASSVMLLKQS